MCNPSTNWDEALYSSMIGGRPPLVAVVPVPTSRTSPSAISSSTIAETVGLASVVARAMLARETRPPSLTTASTRDRLTSRITL
jgi:hypothetical protein